MKVTRTPPLVPSEDLPSRQEQVAPGYGMPRVVLFQAAATVFILRVIGGVVAFFSSVLIARLTDPQSFGNYALILAGAGVLGTVASLGLPMLVTREVATALAKERPGEIRALILIALSLVVVGALTLAVPAFAIAAVGWVADDIPLPALALGALLSLLSAVSAVRAGVLRGMHAVLRADLPDTLVRPLVLMVLAGALYFGGWTLGETDAVALQTIAAIIAFLLGIAFLVQTAPSRGAAMPVVPIALDLARNAIPFWAIATLGIVEVQAPLLLLGFLSEPAEAALYAAASQVVGMITVGLVSVNAPLQGRLVEAWAKHDHDHCQRLVDEGAKLGLLVAVPLIVLLAVLPESILLWFGEEYVAGVPVLRLLLIGAIVNAALGPCRIALNVCGQQSRVLSGVALTVFFTIVVAAITIPSLGARGAAIAASAAMVFWNVLFVYECWRKLGLKSTVFRKGAWTP